MGTTLHETTIDGYRYEMTLFGATAGLKLFHRLVRVLGPSFGHFVQAVESKASTSILDVDIGSDAFVAGIQALTAGVTEADLEHVVNELKKQTSVSVSPDDAKTVPLKDVFELHFRGRLGTMFKWLGWGLKVQFEDFSDAFANMMPPSGGDDSLAATLKAQ